RGAADGLLAQGARAEQDGRADEVNAYNVGERREPSPPPVGGALMAKKKKRVELRKNRSKPPRDKGWTRGFAEHGYAEDATLNQEPVRAKGDLSPKPTTTSTGPNHRAVP